jgi:hypothetical protein
MSKTTAISAKLKAAFFTFLLLKVGFLPGHLFQVTAHLPFVPFVHSPVVDRILGFLEQSIVLIPMVVHRPAMDRRSMVEMV